MHPANLAHSQQRCKQRSNSKQKGASINSPKSTIVAAGASAASPQTTNGGGTGSMLKRGEP
jgi:hypothetical protein